LANIRVIFENNSEPAAKSVKKTCGTGISLILRQFDIREEQGAPNCRNTERAFDELGGGKRTHSDQESGPTSYGLIQALREKHVNVVDYKPKGEKEERLICSGYSHGYGNARTVLMARETNSANSRPEAAPQAHNSPSPLIVTLCAVLGWSRRLLRVVGRQITRDFGTPMRNPHGTKPSPSHLQATNAVGLV
jgi:hypothetical protein